MVAHIAQKDYGISADRAYARAAKKLQERCSYIWGEKKDEATTAEECSACFARVKKLQKQQKRNDRKARFEAFLAENSETNCSPSASNVANLNTSSKKSTAQEQAISEHCVSESNRGAPATDGQIASGGKGVQDSIEEQNAKVEHYHEKLHSYFNDAADVAEHQQQSVLEQESDAVTPGDNSSNDCDPSTIGGKTTGSALPGKTNLAAVLENVDGWDDLESLTLN